MRCITVQLRLIGQLLRALECGGKGLEVRLRIGEAGFQRTQLVLGSQKARIQISERHNRAEARADGSQRVIQNRRKGQPVQLGLEPVQFKLCVCMDALGIHLRGFEILDFQRLRLTRFDGGLGEALGCIQRSGQDLGLQRHRGSLCVQNRLVRGRDFLRSGQHCLTGHTGMAERGRDRGGVGQGLVSDQVRDDPRAGIIDRTRSLEVRGGAGLRCARVGVGQMRVCGLRQIGRIQKTRHQAVCRSELFAPRREVVQRPVYKTQTVGQQRVLDQIGQRRSGSMLFGDDDLIEDVRQIIFVHVNHQSVPYL